MKAIFKFNNGNGALLCSGCSVIIKEGYEFTNEEKKAYFCKGKLDAQYCDKCTKKRTLSAKQDINVLKKKQQEH